MGTVNCNPIKHVSADALIPGRMTTSLRETIQTNAPSHEIYFSSLNSCIITQINLKNNNKQILIRCWHIIHHIMISIMLELVGSLVFQPTYKTVKQTKTVWCINFYSNINISLQQMSCLQHTMYCRYTLCQSE